MSWNDWFEQMISKGTKPQKLEVEIGRDRGIPDIIIAHGVFGWAFPPCKTVFRGKKPMSLAEAARLVITWATNHPMDKSEPFNIPNGSILMDEMRDCLADGLKSGIVPSKANKQYSRTALSALWEEIRKNNVPFEPTYSVDQQLKALRNLAKQFKGVDDDKFAQLKKEIKIRKRAVRGQHQVDYFLKKVDEMLEKLR